MDYRGTRYTNEMGVKHYLMIYLLICSCRGLAIFDALFLLTAILAFGLPKLSMWYNDNLFVYFMAASFGLLHTFR